MAKWKIRQFSQKLKRTIKTFFQKIIRLISYLRRGAATHLRNTNSKIKNGIKNYGLVLLTILFLVGAGNYIFLRWFNTTIYILPFEIPQELERSGITGLDASESLNYHIQDILTTSEAESKTFETSFTSSKYLRNVTSANFTDISAKDVKVEVGNISFNVLGIKESVIRKKIKGRIFVDKDSTLYCKVSFKGQNYTASLKKELQLNYQLSIQSLTFQIAKSIIAGYQPVNYLRFLSGSGDHKGFLESATYFIDFYEDPSLKFSFYSLLADYYININNPDSVIRYADKALEFKKKDFAICHIKGVALLNKNNKGEAKEWLLQSVGAKRSFPNVYIDLGNVHFQNKEYDSAAFCYRKANDIWKQTNKSKTDFYPSLMNQGTLHALKNNTDSASYYFNRINAQFPDRDIYLGYWQWTLGVDSTMKTWEDARNRAWFLVKKDPNYKYGFFYLGIYYANVALIKNLDSAEYYAAKALKIDSNFIDGKFLKAEIASLKGNFIQANWLYQSALNNRYNKDILNGWIESLIQEGNFELALNKIYFGLQKNIYDPILFTQRAECYSYQNKVPEANAYYDIALLLNSSNRRILSSYSRHLNRNSRFAEATKYETLLLELDPYDLDAFELMTETYLQSNDKYKLESHLKNAGERFSSSSIVNHSLADLYNKAGNYDSAMKYIKKHLIENPTDWQALFFKSRLNFGNARFELSLIDLDKIIKNNVLNPEVFVLKGHCHQNLRRYKLAIVNYEKAFKLNNQNCHLLDAWILALNAVLQDYSFRQQHNYYQEQLGRVTFLKRNNHCDDNENK